MSIAFRLDAFLHHGRINVSSTLNMETAAFFKTFSSVYQNTLRYIAEGGSL
jgi:hypothetical protein